MKYGVAIGRNTVNRDGNPATACQRRERVPEPSVMRTNDPYRSIFTLVRMRCAVLAGLVLALGLGATARAEAQLQSGALRFSLDTDMLTMGGVVRDPDNGGEDSTTVVGFGPNHLGNSRVTGYPTASTGLGFGYALSSKFVLGIRTGLGLDVYDGYGALDKTRVLAVG